MNEQDEKERRAARWIWIGGILHLLGCGPLYLTILGQFVGLVAKDANPIGFGLLAFFTFWPSIIILSVGFARGGWTRFKQTFQR